MKKKKLETLKNLSIDQSQKIKIAGGFTLSGCHWTTFMGSTIECIDSDQDRPAV